MNNTIVLLEGWTQDTRKILQVRDQWFNQFNNFLVELKFENSTESYPAENLVEKIRELLQQAIGFGKWHKHLCGQHLVNQLIFPDMNSVFIAPGLNKDQIENVLFILADFKFFKTRSLQIESHENFGSIGVHDTNNFKVLTNQWNMFNPDDGRTPALWYICEQWITSFRECILHISIAYDREQLKQADLIQIDKCLRATDFIGNTVINRETFDYPDGKSIIKWSILMQPNNQFQFRSICDFVMFLKNMEHEYVEFNISEIPKTQSVQRLAVTETFKHLRIFRNIEYPSEKLACIILKKQFPEGKIIITRQLNLQTDESSRSSNDCTAFEYKSYIYLYPDVEESKEDWGTAHEIINPDVSIDDLLATIV